MLGRTRAAAGVPIKSLPEASLLGALVGNGLSLPISIALRFSTWGSVNQFLLPGEDRLFTIPGHVIRGTEASGTLLRRTARYLLQCNYPVPPGTYEVHLLFAETSGIPGGQPATGKFSINGGPIISFDVADDAAGDDVATTKVFTDVSPGTDGMIHVNLHHAGIVLERS